MKHRIISGLIALIAVLWFAPAQAARSFSASQTSPTPTPGQFDMGTTQSVTMGVTNTSTGGNSDERLFQVQFQLSTTACSRCGNAGGGSPPMGQDSSSSGAAAAARRAAVAPA